MAAAPVNSYSKAELLTSAARFKEQCHAPTPFPELNDRAQRLTDDFVQRVQDSKFDDSAAMKAAAQTAATRQRTVWSRWNYATMGTCVAALVTLVAMPQPATLTTALPAIALLGGAVYCSKQADKHKESWKQEANFARELHDFEQYTAVNKAIDFVKNVDIGQPPAEAKAPA